MKDEFLEGYMVTKAEPGKFEGVGDMNGSLLKRLVAASLGLVCAGLVAVMPINAVALRRGTTAARPGPSVLNRGTRVDERSQRVAVTEEVDRAQVENLQRWVAAGHDDWCKDARLVAAEEMWRLAPDFSGGGLGLSVVHDEPGVADLVGKQVMTFEWAPPDGRAVYRVTVQRFAWLLPIAKDAESMVWVPTGAEISVHD